MDDFERAIYFSFVQSESVDASLKAQATAFCDQAKQSPSIVQACLEKLRMSQYGEVQFWCLQTLEELIKRQYASISSQDRLLIRSSLMAAVYNYDMENQRPVYVRNKLAQVVVLLLCMEYPSDWPSAFGELLSLLSKGPAAVDMFCRILVWLDEEVISLEYNRRPDEVALSARIKDAMRQQCIGQIAGAWYSLVVMYRKPKPELAAQVLQTMAKYIPWIDINLVANDSFIPLLFEILVSGHEPLQLREAAADCLLAIISKRMDVSAKFSLLQQLQLGSICARLREMDDADFAPKFSSLLTGFAAEVLECTKKTGSSDTMVDEILPSVFYFMQHDDEDVSARTLQFLSNYVSRMKSGRTINGKEAVHVSHILEVVKYRMRYNPEYKDALDVLDREGQDEEERVAEYRKELFVLLRNVHRVAPTVAKSFVKNLLATILGNADTPFEEVEAGMTLLYKLGEAVPEDDLKADAGDMQEMLQALLTMPLPCSTHRVVCLTFLETVVRYVKFLQHHTAYIPAALAPFVDHRGVHHPSPDVSSRASYLFVRLVKALRPQLVPFVDGILQSLQDTIGVSLKKASVKEGCEDRNHIFEAVGLLIGAEELPKDKQETLLSAVLIPLYSQVDAILVNKDQYAADPFAAIAVLQQIVLAITYLSKGFTEQQLTDNRWPALGDHFRQSIDVVVRILVAYPQAELIRSKIISFLHRMVDVLGTSVFPFLPTAIQQLLSQSEPKDLVEFIQLINQLINKFKARICAILQEIFPSILERTFDLLPKNGFPEGAVCNTEELRELQELQKAFLNFIHALVSNNLSSVLVFQINKLNDVFQLLLSCACNHKDVLVRRVSVQIFCKLAMDWCGPVEKVPGFNRFMIDRFTADCIASTLQNTFNMNDANTVMLLGDISVAQTTLYDKFGGDFLLQMKNVLLSALQCPPELAEEYCAQIRSSRSLKPFLVRLRDTKYSQR